MHKLVISFLTECIVGTLEGAAARLPPMRRRRRSLTVEASTILESILTFIKGYHGLDNALQGASGLSSELALSEAPDSCTTIDTVTSRWSRDTTRWSL
ncbi:hypothetical protein Pmar_PMAR006375 [Perkinsus marinus ATCC 50983]|uniref:Uncharacterized protein n=1 Tax=Perkinsus marinus (strain ATCC 50983 / TXsc) TaxID=423536 RepID=C5K9I3_PERM5|nr:hypothetical protein Pmar_PMAR006375 [Perkinsus marinus ATCC 50983]EER18755.1 hypothetical protein Pmar_PMAR006375 [Perkinsus marinus ATCC 50983]|eukprot:XP_002786959.1 hypothetical protein Pmar_PMAR006375 [Perkinsus marinus ATCC 50983]